MMKNIQNNKKVLIALSGGVDSAVSAYLLQQKGYEIEGAFMKNWSSTTGLKDEECPWLVDRQDALRVSAFLRIKMHTLDFEKQYRKNVLNYFFEEYKAGRTPNPDVMCNKEIKFKILYEWAMKNGFDYLATGHYAQIGQDSNKEWQLKKAKDPSKDQTYFIYNIKNEQLERLKFPIGGMLKVDVKKMAKKIGLPNANKKESMGLCFVGRIRLKDFLQQKLKPKIGKVRNEQAEIIGEHSGLHYYTIGQRQGIEIGSGGPYYVYKKDLKKNELWVTTDPGSDLLKVKEIEIHSVNWLSSQQKYPMQVVGRYRHQGELHKLNIEKPKRGVYRVKFQKPQVAIASGQSLVIYDKNICLGGGVIV